MGVQTSGSRDLAAGLPSDPFWDFSLEIYARPKVAQALLSLQDRRGLDVNLLLFCLWCGQGGRAISQAEFAKLEASNGPWRQEIVEVLRSLRRALKSAPPLAGEGPELLRQKILDCEIFAEAIAQRALRENLGEFDANPAAGPTHAIGNIRAYLECLNREADNEDLTDLVTVLKALWPELTRQTMTADFQV